MDKLITKHYSVAAAVEGNRIVKSGGTDYSAIQATDASAPIIGVCENVGASAADIAAGLVTGIDVVQLGISLVECGGVIPRDGWFTADANGKAVAAVFTPGETVHVCGKVLEAAVDGDIVPAFIMPIVVGNDTSIATRDVTIATAAVKTLNATPVELVPAPGAGKAIIVEEVLAHLDYNSVAYDGVAAGEDLAIKYSNAAGATIATIEATGFVDQAADQLRVVKPTTTAAFTPVANAPIVAHMLTGEIATGNSPLKFRVRYRTVDIGW